MIQSNPENSDMSKLAIDSPETFEDYALDDLQGLIDSDTHLQGCYTKALKEIADEN